MAGKQKASGRNIPEAERSGRQVKLRLPEDVEEDLDRLAERWGLTRSGTVARLIEQEIEGRYCHHDVMVGLRCALCEEVVER